MNANEQMDVMGDFVEGTINDYTNGLIELNEAVVKVTEYFVNLMFQIEKNWAGDIVEVAELHHRDSLVKSRALYERAALVFYEGKSQKEGQENG